MKFRGFKIKKLKEEKPKYGGVYFCLMGDYVGELFVLCECKDDSYGFRLHDRNVWVPKEKFEYALRNKILEYKEKLPKDVEEITKAQFAAENKGGTDHGLRGGKIL